MIRSALGRALSPPHPRRPGAVSPSRSRAARHEAPDGGRTGSVPRVTPLLEVPQPTVPATPAVPSEPVTPAVPDEPTTPAVPDAPVVPADPDPGSPADPAEPAEVPQPADGASFSVPPARSPA